MQEIRPPGLNEKRSLIRDALGLYGSVIVCATYKYESVSRSTELPLDNLVKALKACIVEHPMLCMTIQDAKTDSPSFFKPPTVNLGDHIRLLDFENADEDDAASVQTLLLKAQNETVYSNHPSPPWRLYLLHDPSPTVRFHAAFSFSHGIADGTSGQLFHQSILRALQSADDLPFDSNRIWDLPSTKPLPPPLETAVKLPISLSFLLGPAIAEYFPSWLARILGFGPTTGPNTWLGAPSRPARPHRFELLETALRTTFIPNETLQRALKVCRAHNARLTGLVVLLVARALAASLHARGKGYTNFATQTVIGMRQFIPGDQDIMGNFVSAVFESMNVTECNVKAPLSDNDWTVIRNLTKKLSKASSTVQDQPIGLLPYISNIRNWTLQNTEKPADLSFEVSNIGAFDSKVAGSEAGSESWRLENIVFSQSANAVGTTINTCLASLERGPLAVVISWWPGMLAVDNEGVFVEEVIQGIADGFEAMDS